MYAQARSLLITAVLLGSVRIYEETTSTKSGGCVIKMTKQTYNFQRSHKFHEVIATLLVPRLEMNALLDGIVVAYKWRKA